MIAAAVFLALAFMAPAPALAQTAAPISQAFATVEEVYTVRNIKVDETADTASVARDLALLAARRNAFSRLARRIIPSQDQLRLAQQSDDALANLITDFEVAEEKSRGQRYLARLTMRFDPNKIRSLLRQYNIRNSETGARPVLILPVLEGASGRLLWEANAWHDALIAAVAQTGSADDRLAPLLLPSGDAEDASAISADQAVTGDMQSLGVMMRRYGAADILLMHAVQSNTPAGVAFDITLRRFAAGAESAQIEHFDSTPGEAAELVLERASLALLNGVQQAWINETALDFSQRAVVEVSTPLTSLQDFLTLQKRLQETPMIQRVELRALSVAGAQIDLHFLGSQDKLVTALTQRGLALTQEAGRWQLR